MVNPGAFLGLRREFLIQEIEGYIQAVEEGRAAEFVADVIRRYLKRFPISLAHNVEPTAEHLAQVNDNVPDPEVEMPDEDKLTSEEYKRQMLRYQDERGTLKFRFEQIRRWLHYQYAKRKDMSAKDSSADNPWTIILHRLTGVGLTKPHKPQAFALWYKSNTYKVNKVWQKHTESMKENGHLIAPSKQAAAFQTFKSQLYRNLGNEEKQSWEALASEEHEVATKEFNEKLNAPISQDPQDLQNCLERLPSVVKPLIDIIVQATGCLVSIYVVGPQPADGGRLHIASFHGGKTLGSVKQNFIEAEHNNFKRFILPVYSNFVKKCFTVEMCHARALPHDTPTLESIGFTSEEEGIALHSIEGDLFNNNGGSEMLPAQMTKATKATKKPLREAPVKRVKDAKLGAAKSGGQKSGDEAPEAWMALSSASSPVPVLPCANTATPMPSQDDGTPPQDEDHAPSPPPCDNVEPEDEAVVMDRPKTPAPDHPSRLSKDTLPVGSLPLSPAVSRAGSPLPSRAGSLMAVGTPVEPSEKMALIDKGMDEVSGDEEAGVSKRNAHGQRASIPVGEEPASDDPKKRKATELEPTMLKKSQQSMVTQDKRDAPKKRKAVELEPKTSKKSKQSKQSKDGQDKQDGPTLTKPADLVLPDDTPKWAFNAIKLF
ncbi:hypothetical protein ARMSODRAFT_1023781 [Armillaria solidipes]|uniref:Uncharacterized protein n=1 Tax=Armillaria solidipes TaxID=1076256 RepID=A0A2H3AXZ8_9AGAR|nr:hypothetical protein ARMSODRAFT_1023781 [Armillaria solidipes]